MYCFSRGSSRTRLLSALSALGLVSAVGVVQAQTTRDRAPAGNGDGMDTHLFRPAIDSKGQIASNGTEVLGHKSISFGMVLDYGRNLLRVNPDRNRLPNGESTGGASALVAHSFQATFGVNYGLFNLLSVGASVPVVMLSGGSASGIGPTGATYDADNLNAQKLGGFALHAKLRLLRATQGFGLALIGQAGVPLGSAPRQLGADPGFWYWPRVVAEGRLGDSGIFRATASVGYRGHTGQNTRFELDPQGREQLVSGRFVDGNLGTYGAGLSLRVIDALELVGETYGTVLLADADSRQKVSQELLGGIKLYVDPNSFLTLGAGGRVFSTGAMAADQRLVLGFVLEPSIGDTDGDGIMDDEDQCITVAEDKDGDEDSDGCPEFDKDKDGIPDDQDSCPTVPEDKDGDADEDGCPEIRDTDKDHDGIVDARDKCPNDPEDRDGYEDKDGCPEPDNDRDGILDGDDRCPNDPEDKDGYEDSDGCPDYDNDKDQIPDSRDKCPTDPENYNGFQDDDGCPEKNKVIIEENSIVILEQVQFQRGSAQIRPESTKLLDEVAQTLREHPEFKVVEVAGHADERGSDQINLKLTQLRAAAVASALQKRGVAASRLLSQGYGEYCPLDSRTVVEAYDKNRRVEFKIAKTEDGPTPIERGCRRAKDAGVVPPTLP